MSLQPNATNNAAASAYFYTKQEIDTAVQIAISSIGNLSTSALFTNLTVSSITVNPSGSINGAGSISTATLLANGATINTGTINTTLNVPYASVAGNPAGGGNYTAIAYSGGGVKIAQGTTGFEGMNLLKDRIEIQQGSTGSSAVPISCSTASPAFPNAVALNNISSINGAPLNSFANNSTFTTASISSATVSSINGSRITPNVGAFQFYDLTGLVPAVISGSNNPVFISTLQTGLGAGVYTANITFAATTLSTPNQSLMLGIGTGGGLAAGNAIVEMVEPNTFGGSGFPINLTNSCTFSSSNGTIPINYSYSATGFTLSNSRAAGAAPNVYLQLFKVA